MKAILDAFPELKKSAVQTFVTDLKNPKYCYFLPRTVVVNSEGKLIFADVALSREAENVAPSEETPTEEPPLETEPENENVV